MDLRSLSPRYAAATLAYTIGVILFGAFVRASGSGAGCGSSWPTCQGDLIPLDARGAQAIEFTHRATSAFTGVLIIGLVIVALRGFAAGHPARRAAWWSLFFVITEGAFGAALVRGEWVADDASLARGLIVPAHLVNTLFLLAALTFTWWFMAGGDRLLLRSNPKLTRLLGVASLGMIVVAATGAVTALADTLFPSESVASGLAEDFSETAAWLTQLRIAHPITAIVVGGFVAWLAFARGHRLGRGGRAAAVVIVLVGLQVVAGFVNVLLLTPIWLQLVHLLLADLLWVSLVWFAADALSDPRFGRAAPTGHLESVGS